MRSIKILRFLALAFIIFLTVSAPSSAASDDYVTVDHIEMLEGFKNNYAEEDHENIRNLLDDQRMYRSFLKRGTLHGPIKVTEYFNYYCAHCYHLEDALVNWVSSNEDNIEFVRAPVAISEKNPWPFTAYYTLLDSMQDGEEASGLDKSHLALFKLVHNKKTILTTADEYIDFYKSFGVRFDEERFSTDFDANLNNDFYFGNYREFDRITYTSKINGVPLLVVEDVFLAREYVIGGHSREQMLSTATFLVKKIMDRSYNEALNELSNVGKWILPKIQEADARSAVSKQ